MKAELKPWERMHLQKEAEKERWEAIGKLALQQGLLLCKLTPRRYLIVVIGTSLGVHLTPDNTHHTWLSGEVVCGPVSYEACLEYIQTHTNPVPDALKR